MVLPFQPITKKYFFLMALCSLVFSHCASRLTDPWSDPVLNGNIAYPFIDRTDPIGVNGNNNEKFVIRSNTGKVEYVIEIPNGARDYDVEIPLAQMGKDASNPEDIPSSLPNPQVADKEVVSVLPKVESLAPGESTLMDDAFGVGKKDGPTQSPSYLLGINKINNYYKRHEYEYALIEINNLLAFYPTSSKLYKMKGTVYLKTNNLSLAEKSWQRALELEPSDSVLRKALDKLKLRIAKSTPPMSGNNTNNTQFPPTAELSQPASQNAAPSQNTSEEVPPEAMEVPAEVP